MIAAWNRMRSLDVADSPLEWQVQMWIGEWQDEAQKGLQRVDGASTAETPNPGNPTAPETPLSELTPAERLQRAVLAAMPEATAIIRGDQVLVFFEDVSWQDNWELNLGAEASAWKIRSWELSWELAEQQSPPSNLTLQGNITLLHSSRRNPPSMPRRS